ncbi:reverse transcriptase-like protein [Novosphingobium sp. Chol11]|uniref:ribonuclease HI n=1 Tax=Novosphingobium sp. Chol11 TaxID=1385763 RepID=UPI0025F4FF4D|nr:reverse transcriptase-like protein [Novosphingobium sp. Chol11]
MGAKPINIWFDGGCRPNPGAMQTAVVARGVTHHRPAIGHGSNTDAEWRALLHALEVAQMLGESDVVLIGDSAFVIAQASGAAKPNPDYQAYHAEFAARSATFTRVRLRQTGRAQNLAGIALEQIAAGFSGRQRMATPGKPDTA